MSKFCSASSVKLSCCLRALNCLIVYRIFSTKSTLFLDFFSFLLKNTFRRLKNGQIHPEFTHIFIFYTPIIKAIYPRRKPIVEPTATSSGVCPFTIRTFETSNLPFSIILFIASPCFPFEKRTFIES